MKKKKGEYQIPAFIFGPFVGEMWWEMFHFSGYMIYLRKQNPSYKFIVYTRSDRFDLYGKYADILVPLSIENDDIQNKFKCENINSDGYELLIRIIKSKYETRFNIVNHIYPVSYGFRYEVKWQFQRYKMDYDFKARENNNILTEALFKNMSTGKTALLDLTPFENYDMISIIFSSIEEIRKSKNMNIIVFYDNLDMRYVTDYPKFRYLNSVIRGRTDITPIGCVSSILDNVDMTFGNFSSIFTRMSILKNVPVISINEKMKNSELRLINPYEIKILRVEIDDLKNLGGNI